MFKSRTKPYPLKLLKRKRRGKCAMRGRESIERKRGHRTKKDALNKRDKRLRESTDHRYLSLLKSQKK